MFPQVSGCVSGFGTYDLTVRRPAVQAEDLMQLALVVAEFCGHAAGFGPAAGGGVDQHGLLDSCQGVEQGTHRQVQAGVPGCAAHQVCDLQGEHAGEHVDADVRLGPVVHGAEGDDVGVFELAEGELGFGLGPVGGDDLGGGPVIVIGDQHVLAEELLFQGRAGSLVDAPGEAQVFGLVAVQPPGDYPAGPGFAGDSGDLGLHLLAGAAGLAAAEGGGQLVQLLAGLGQGGAGEPGRLCGVQLRGVGQDRPALRAVDLAAGVVGGQPVEAALIHDGPGRGGQGGQVGAVAGGHRPDVVQAGSGEVGEVVL